MSKWFGTTPEEITTNVQVAGEYPVERKISDMVPGEVGYTVPWAYDPETGELNTSYTIRTKYGTARMRVSCSIPGSYQIEVEEATSGPILSLQRRGWFQRLLSSLG